MTEQKQETKKGKAAKEERKEASKIVHRLQESGDFQRLQEQLLCKILYDHPEWWDKMRQQVRESVQSKEAGVLDITLDELSHDLVKAGKDAVPEEIREAMMAQIQEAVASQSHR
ncbi:expressed unknown protein [Seminavis robusta]|uniref:Transcription and mRNA export factor ENY2 n=1 Tax=Seminavis robusta TaxID=568900 RepID=A0A9N8DJZ3_9STRA|nr:expressed unknown protein [Seminavis robusta]|eukprot:Sro185_g080290.1 n/a (114) ;mRNA; f:37082-37536